MYYNKVEICGVNTSDLVVLTDAEKKDLLIRTKQGDKEARNELICGNLRLVLSIIQRFTNRRENMDDLFQVGCIGLVKAVDNFNIDLDVKFSTYAVPMIIGEIRRYLRDNNTIRISRSVRDLAYRALQAREEWMREKQSEPDLAQLAEVLGEKKEAVLRAMEAIVEPISLYEPVFTDNGAPPPCSRNSQTSWTPALPTSSCTTPGTAATSERSCAPPWASAWRTPP